MSRFLHEGGWTMFLILALVLPAIAFAILHLVLARVWTLLTALGVLALILVIGFYGWHEGRSLTDRSVEAIDDATDRETMRAQGYLEASRPMQLAGLVDGVLILAVFVGELRRRRRS